MNYFKNIKQILVVILFLIVYYADAQILYDDIYKESIHSVQMYNKSWEMSRPIINLNSDDVLKLSFDDIDLDMKDYYYKIIHCTSDWEPTDISYFNYVDGFEENQIEDYAFSINTLVSYIHYNLEIPNDNIKIKLSGNYILKVYENNDEENLVLTRRFYCVEKEVSVSATIQKPIDLNHRETGQEVDFSINYSGFEIENPRNDIKVVIVQNGRTDTVINNLKPFFIGDSKLDYNYDIGNIFDGNNEFRNFEFKSISYYSEFIESINYIEPIYHINLKQNLSKYRDLYFFENDINGKYLVKITDGDDSELEADYAKVHFNLFYDVPLKGKVYVFGALNNWNMNERNEMKYNFENHYYESDMMLKQGYYNYCFAYKEEEEKSADLSFFEGTHYETENEYIIYVYHKSFSDNYEKLVGYQVVNSQKK